jgi:ankyrin repeat protein
MRDNNGFTTLHQSSYLGNLNILELLVLKGGDLNLENTNGITLMHAAAQGNSPLIMVKF